MLKYKDFKTDTGGNVAMMFAATTLMLLTGIGAAIDYSNMTRTRTALQAQVDAAVLAAARIEIKPGNNGFGNAVGNSKNDREIRLNAAHQVIEANGFDLSGIDPVLTLNTDTVELRAELDYKPFFAGILGVNTVRLTAEAESGLAGKELINIALVLDNTDSMGVNGKLDALKSGAIELVEAIEESGSGSKIGIVPFSRYVRVPDSAASESWLEVPAEYDTPRTSDEANYSGGTCHDVTKTRNRDGVEETYTSQECTGQTVTYQTEFSTVESRWEGCVGTRMTPFSEQDGSYVHKIPGLLNTVPKEVSGLTRDHRSYCPREIQALTDDYAALKNDINGLFATDNTYIPSGLIWGQRVLSPGLPFDNVQTDGAARQVIVLMTDGKNTTEIDESAGAAAKYDAPPYINSVGSSDIADAANKATARLCASIKDADIEIYTIAFQVADPATQLLLKNCASSIDHAVIATSNAQLVAEFKTIANRLEADIRLIR